MGKNDTLRKQLLDQLQAKVEGQVLDKLPQLRDNAGIGLRSLSADDELTKIEELEAQADDLLDTLTASVGWAPSRAPARTCIG